MAESTDNKISFTASTVVLQWLKTQAKQNQAINAALESYIAGEAHAGEGLLDKDVYNEVDGEQNPKQTNQAPQSKS
jgi:predicted transcriptional regulator